MNRFKNLRRSVGRSHIAVSKMETLESRRLFAASATPFIDDAGVLQVTGTNKADNITVAVDASLGTLSVTVNGVTTDFPAFPTDVSNSLVINGGNGNDQISVIETSNVQTTLSFTIFGGNGKDLILGASGDDILDGGNGKDLIDGAGGNDTLIGGHSKDTLLGGDGVDHFVNDNLDKLGDVADGETVDVVDMVKPKGPKK